MYGVIVKFRANPGRRAELIQVLSEGFRNMALCHSYILAEDDQDENGVWLTEIWESAEAHAAAVARPDIAAVIASATADNLSAGPEMRFLTRPVAGQGLFASDGAWRPNPA